MAQRGKYIVIEGGDGTGKSTQLQKLADYFQSKGVTVLTVEEPGGTPMADEIRRLLKNKLLIRSAKTNIALFTAARIDLWEKVIAPALVAGKMVISSRNYYSTLVYQGYAEGMDLDYIEAISRLSLPQDYCQPDLALVLSADSRLERLEKRGATADFAAQNDYFESQSNNFQTKIDQGYLHLAKKLKLPLVNALGTPDEVFARILRVLAEKSL